MGPFPLGDFSGTKDARTRRPTWEYLDVRRR
jgi:hypothetical protein